MAIGFIHGLAARGISVPHDLSVAGYDDIPASAYVASGLTTVRPDYEDQGRAAIEVLLADIEGRKREPLRHPRGELFARSTTAAP